MNIKPFSATVLFIGFILSGFQSHGMSGTYTIGDTASDYKSFTAAIADLKANGMSDCVYFEVRDGDYNECISIPWIDGMGSGFSVTFESYSGNPKDVRLHNSSNSSGTNNFTIYSIYSSHVHFKNITIQRDSTLDNSRVVWFDESTDFSVEGCIIIGSKTAKNKSQQELIELGDDANDVLIKNNILKYGSMGVIDFVNHGARVTIENNVFDSISNSSVYYSGAETLNITGNRFIGSKNSTYAINLSNESHNANISGNHIYMPVAIAGILCEDTDPLYTDDSIWISNNFITIDDYSGYGIQLDKTEKTNCIFNTINMTSKGNYNYGNAALYYNVYGKTSGIIKNNIFCNSGKGYCVIYMYETFSLEGAKNVNYNNYFTLGKNAFLSDGTPDSISHFIAQGTDSQSVSTNPGFVSDTDLHVNNSLLDNAGVSFKFVKKDIDGDKRSSTPDIGADEFDYHTGIVENHINQSGIKIYPNPFSDKIFIDCPTLEMGNIQVVAMDGKILLNSNRNLTNNNECDLSYLIPGVYILKIKSQSFSDTYKIIKE